MTDNRILMNVVPMMSEVVNITNPMIRKPALPDFRLAPYKGAECMGISSLDQLDRALNGHVLSWGKQKMNVVRHENESVQEIIAFATVVKNSFKKQSSVILDLKESSAIPCREGYEIGSGRREES
jgi:hypothetical protein